MYDGEDSFFPCCQKKYNILGREKSFPLVSSVVETSEKYLSSIFSAILEEIFHLEPFSWRCWPALPWLWSETVSDGQNCPGNVSRIALPVRFWLPAGLTTQWIWWDFPRAERDVLWLHCNWSSRLLLSRGRICEDHGLLKYLRFSHLRVLLVAIMLNPSQVEGSL